MSSELPSKLFFRIGEVAGLVGVEPHVLRYWEREFRSIRPTKSAKGQRVYSRKDVENLLRVRDLLYRDGFTIAGAKKRLQRGVALPGEEAQHESPATEVEHEEREPEAPTVQTMHAQDATDAAPTSPRPIDLDHDVREKLNALRTEVEGFLAELET